MMGPMIDLTMRAQAESLIDLFDPSLEKAKVIAPFEHSLAAIEHDYEELIQLSQHRERYNVLWAFSYANSRLQQEVSKVFTDQVKEKILSHAGSHRNKERQQTIVKKFSVIEDHLTDMIHRTRTSTRAFRSATVLISLAEIMITFLIVILVAEISQMIDRAVSIPQLSIIFIGVFGLMRMFLEKAKERFLFNWRWNMYQDTVDRAFRGIIIMTSTSYILAYYIKRGTFLQDIDDLLEKTLTELFRKESQQEMRTRRAAHITARSRQLTLERITQLKLQMDKKTIHTALGIQEAPRTVAAPAKRRIDQLLTRFRKRTP
jgi:hypothetical protein